MALADDVLEILARTLGTVGDHTDLYDNGGSWFADTVDDRGYGLAVAADRTVLVVSDEGFVRHRLRLIED